MAGRILVTGQRPAGGAVARHLFRQGWCAASRDVLIRKRRNIKQLGADVVRAEDDPASLKSVLRGCTGVFGVTDFWEAFLREYDQGVNPH